MTANASWTDPYSFSRGWTLRNRVWLAPMTNLQSHADGHLSEEERAWLTLRAAGGFSAIETCATHVAADGQGWPGELGIHHDGLKEDWARLCADVHGHGALLIAQLFHGGARANPQLVPRRWTAWPSEAERAEGIVSGDEEDVQGVIDAFGAAAGRAHSAGLAGVELHGAHGYLLCQFLGRHNQRGDGLGGSLEERASLLLRVVRRARAAMGEDRLVGVRLSPEDRQGTWGMHLDDTLQVAAWLVEEGIDFLHLSLWDAEAMTQARPADHPIRLFREAIGQRCALVVAGGMWTSEDASRALDRGADIVALGRAALPHPAWPREAVDPAFRPMRPPIDPEHLRRAGVSEAFLQYMGRWPGFVAAPASGTGQG